MTTARKFAIVAMFALCFGAVAVYAQVGSEDPATANEVEEGGKLEWTKVNSTGLRDMLTIRAKVPGGWLVTSQYAGGGRDSVGGMAFVPDPEHTWKIEELPVTNSSKSR